MPENNNYFKISGIEFEGGSCLLSGNINPSTEGLDLPIGSLYLRNNGEIWKKVGNTLYDWEILSNSRSSVFVSENENPALTIIQKGSGDALLVEDKESIGDSPFVIKSNGDVGIGTQNPNSKLQVVNDKISIAVLGTELITNGEFTGNASGWTLGTNWNYNDNNVVLDNIGSSGALKQNINVVAGKSYLVSFSMQTSIVNNAFIRPSIGNVIGNILGRGSLTDLGTVSTIIVADTTGTVEFALNVIDGTNTGTVTIDNVSIKEIESFKPVVAFYGSYNDGIPAEIRIVPNQGNISVGYSSGKFLTTGIYNNSIGVNSLSNNTSGSFNIAIGGNSLYNNSTGEFNTAIGMNTLFSNTTGTYNSAIGVNVLKNNITGTHNTAIGTYSLYNNTYGLFNTSIGVSSLFNNTTGDFNVAIGLNSLYYNTTGSQNFGIGTNSLFNNKDGSYNVAIGVNSFLNKKNGSFNIAIGYQAGSYKTRDAYPLENCNDSIYIGKYTRSGAAYTNVTNEIVIGNNAIGGGSNTTTIGNASTTMTIINGSIKCIGSYNLSTSQAANLTIDSDGLIRRSVSSKKYKTQIEDLDPKNADAVIYGCRPVWYRSACELDNPNWSWYGLIAEELAEIDPRLVRWDYPLKQVVETEAQEAQERTEDENNIQFEREAKPVTYKMVPDTDAPPQPEGVFYDRLTVLLISVVQRQKKKIDDLESRIIALEEKLKKMP